MAQDPRLDDAVPRAVGRRRQRRVPDSHRRLESGASDPLEGASYRLPSKRVPRGRYDRTLTFTKIVTALIDRLRRDIRDRLEQLLAEADKLRRVLGVLDPRGGSTSSPRSPAPTAPTGRRAPRPSARLKASPAGPRARGLQGATKTAVLDALAKSGAAMTAGEVAAVTGLGRGTVSTTLSKLTKTGEVSKAQRGYRLPDSDRGAPASAAAAAAE